MGLGILAHEFVTGVCTGPPPLGESIHCLLDLPLMRLAQDRAQALLDSHRHLPADPLMLVGSPIPSRGRVVVAVPAGGIPQYVPNHVDALLA